MNESCETLLVGAGPIGIEVAIALKRAGVPYRHVEAGCIGATVDWYAPGTVIFSSPDRLSIAGVPFVVQPHVKATREDYLAYLRAVASQFDLKVETYRRVLSARRTGDGRFECVLAPSAHGTGGPLELSADFRGDATITAVRLVLAIGDMQLPKLLGLEGERGDRVSHYFADPHPCYRQRVVVVGAKNSAAEAVVRLSRVEAEVTVCQRGPGFADSVKPWLRPEISSLIAEKRVRLMTHVVPARIGEDQIAVRSLVDGGEEILPFDRLFLLTGYRQDTRLFDELGVRLIGDDRVPACDGKTLETNVPGVYVAGTAAAGTQGGGYKVFIENCHRHAAVLAAALSGRPCPPASAAERGEEYRET